MANVFDQFDAPAAQAPQGNVFDQFDKPVVQGRADLGSMSGQAMDQMTGGITQKANAGILGLVQGGIVDPIMGRGFNVGGRYNEVLDQQRQDQAAYNAENPGKAAVGNALGVGAGLMLMPSIGTGIKGAALTGAAYGGILGAAQDGNTVQEHVNNAVSGTVAGGVGGLALGAAAKGISKLITPFEVPADNALAAAILNKEGVDVTAGQKTGSDWLKYRESMFGNGSINEDQASQFTKAALAKVGANADRATPQVMQGIDQRIGSEFDKLATNNHIVPDPQNGFQNWRTMATDVSKAAADYASSVGAGDIVTKIQNTADDILNKMQTGQIDGAWYKATRSELGRFASSTSKPEAANAARDLIHALDDGMEASIAANNPKDLGAWSGVRKDYRNFLVLQKAASGAGSDAAKGIISPSALRNATANVQGRKNYVMGKGDFADLARAGEAVLKPLPNSGTAQRLSTLAPNALGAIAGALYGGSQGGDFNSAAIGAGVGAVAGREILTRALMSKAGQAYLSNQVAAKSGPLVEALASRLGPLGGRLGYDAYSALRGH